MLYSVYFTLVCMSVGLVRPITFVREINQHTDCLANIKISVFVRQVLKYKTSALCTLLVNWEIIHVQYLKTHNQEIVWFLLKFCLRTSHLAYLLIVDRIQGFKIMKGVCHIFTSHDFLSFTLGSRYFRVNQFIFDVDLLINEMHHFVYCVWYKENRCRDISKDYWTKC